jgi:hypothetical protein
VAASLIVALANPLVAAPLPEEDLARGIGLVRQGDFQGAVPPLARVIDDLTPDLRRRGELSRAYLFLGVAYLELGQELDARGKFREALRNNPKLRLAPTEFSAQVMRVFETERAVLEPKKKKIPLPLLLVLGGGAATAGVAVAASGGGSPTTTLRSGASTTTTTAPPSGGGPSTTTPGGGNTTTTTTTITLPTTSTTLSGSTTTTSTTTTTTTSTTTTTTPPSCTYSLAPDQTFQSLGGTGVCTVSVNQPTCPWTVEVFPASGWLTFTSATSGTGSGSVSYSVAPLNLIGTRSAVIRAQQNVAARCNITQHGLLGARGPDPAPAVESRLELPGGRAQIVLNGSAVAFQQDGVPARLEGGRLGASWVEGTVVTADGRPGTWRFDLSSGGEPGTLRVVAGQASLVTPSSIVFRLSGKPGERIVFAFRLRGPSAPPD